MTAITAGPLTAIPLGAGGGSGSGFSVQRVTFEDGTDEITFVFTSDIAVISAAGWTCTVNTTPRVMTLGPYDGRTAVFTVPVTLEDGNEILVSYTNVTGITEGASSALATFSDRSVVSDTPPPSDTSLFYPGYWAADGIWTTDFIWPAA